MVATTFERTVLLTGATGNWGRATLRQFRERPDIRVRAFALPSRSDDAVLAEFAGSSQCRV